MGLFDWIGEAIGGAFSALAEFIGDAFSGVFKAIGGSVTAISKDMYKDVVTEVENPESDISKDAGRLQKIGTEPITKGFDHTVKELSKKHSPITPQEAETQALALWDKIRLDSGVATVGGIAVEAASLGQIEGVMTAFQIASRISASTDFANKVAMMQYETWWLKRFQQRLNEVNRPEIPGATDLVRMELREVFHPDFRDELLIPSTSEKFKEAMRRHGYDDYWSDSYWAAHWVLPSLGDLDEMLHRRHINIDEWRTMVRRNDYLPAWIDRREKIIYKPYTRVDVRRMWDLAQLSEQEVYENYLDLGYDDDHAKKMTIWTKIYVLAVEIRARYSKGWISAAEVKSEIIAAGMPPIRAETWVQKIVKADQEDRMVSERDLTKAEIVKGVKEGFLTVSEGVELLVDMGYDEAEAEYIIAINVEAIGGSPETLEEFQDIVNKRRIAMGLPIRKKEPKTKQTGTGSDKTTEAPTGKKKQK